MATDLTNIQWQRIRPLIPGSEMERTGSRGGRPWRDPRAVLDGILWVLRTGARWGDLPRRYPPPQTCHRRFQKWVREGVLDEVLTALGEELREPWRGTRPGQPVLTLLAARRSPVGQEWNTGQPPTQSW
jgi:transposase